MNVDIRWATAADCEAMHGLVSELALYERAPNEVSTNPSVFRDAPRYLFSAQSPFRLRLGYLPQLLPWLALFLRASLPGRSRRSAGDLAV